MHIILGILGLAVAAYFLVLRARRGAEIAHDVLEVADDIRAAARRWGLRRKYNTHPVDDVDDPRIALAGVGSAFIALDDLPTADTRQKLEASLARTFDLPAKDAQELVVLGQWLVESSGGPAQSIGRITKRLIKISDTQQFGPLTAILQDTCGAELSGRQKDALDEIKRAFRIT